MKKEVLKLDHISVAFKDNKVLDEIEFTAYEGEIIGVVAPNGTGKTTMFNVIANYLKPNGGQVIFNETQKYTSEKEELKIHKQLTTFPDQSELFENLTGMDHLKLYANMWKGSTKDLPKIIERLNMGYVKKRVKTYSLGMRQRLCFAMMVASDTPIMLMDEVMNGLDVANTAIISEILLEMKQAGKLIFIASHLLENLDLYADRVIYLKGGHIIFHHELNDQADKHIKISINNEKYEVIKNKFQLSLDSKFIGGHLLCIPLSGLSEEEQTHWIERLLPFTEKELTIGPLGTLEYYQKYYSDPSI